MSISKNVVINGQELKLKDTIAVTRYGSKVSLLIDKKAREKVQASYDYINKQILNDRVIYGVNTNYGGMADKTKIDNNDINLQTNLIWGLKCGTGEKISPEHVKAGMLLRANSLAKGVSGINPELIERLVKFINFGMTPVVRKYGSIGASGDLVPLANVMGAIAGIDPSFRVDYNGNEISSIEALELLGLKPIKLTAKDGIAMVNGTSMMTGIAQHVVYDTCTIFKLYTYINAFCINALQAASEPFHPFIHMHKPFPGQVQVAEIISDLISGSKFVLCDANDSCQSKDKQLIQDRYSLRCIPQYAGVILDGIRQIKTWVEVEGNAVSDNPLIDAENDKIYHGGNFLGQYIGVGMDQLRYHIALMAKHLDTQLGLLVEPAFNNNLPPSLVGNSTSNVKFGLKGLQICANSIMPVLLHLSASIAPLFPTHAEQYNQNINSQGYSSANLAWDSVTIMKQYLAISLIFAVQAIDLRSQINYGNYDGRSYLSPKLTPLYEAVHTLLNQNLSLNKPLIRHNHEQSLDEYIAKITNDIGSINGIIMGSVAKNGSPAIL
jgi:phenylalanine ammonia-lyase